MMSQKSVFWEALLISILVFALGILAGYFIENSRTNKIELLNKQASIDLLDIRIQNEAFNSPKINCESAINENIAFANKIYEQAKLLDKYESANQLSEAITTQHKEYDLLRAQFWLNSILLKNRCNATYHNIVYLYKYNNPSLELKAKQTVFSRLLGQVKEESNKTIMLIPFSGDNDLSSIRLMMKTYNITESELPVILIDEKIKITELEDKNQILKLLN